MPTKDPNQGNVELEEDLDTLTAPGQIRLQGGDIMARDQAGVFNIRQAAGLLQLETLLFSEDLCIIVSGCDYVIPS